MTSDTNKIEQPMESVQPSKARRVAAHLCLAIAMFIALVLLDLEYPGWEAPLVFWAIAGIVGFLALKAATIVLIWLFKGLSE